MRQTSNNPALTRIPAFAGANKTVGFGDRPAPTADPIEQGYFGPDATSRDTGRMTIEDVTVRLAILLGIAVVTGAATWVLGLEALAIPAAIIGMILGLVISFKQITNPAPIIAYAAIEGVFLGGISKLFESAYPGIAVQAVLGTAGVAGGALYLYRSGKVKVTPKFTKMILAGLIGFLALAVTNLVAGFFIDGGLGLRDGGPLAIGFSLLAIGLASMVLIIDFDYVDKGAKAGLPERYGWLAAFGLMVTLVWLYIEILRLLSYLRGDN
ncbi:MAG: Bax inhibitor-1/YccA family protein [Mycobacteriales bacterium]